MRMLFSYSGEAHGDIELVADGRGVACGWALSAASSG